MNYLQSRLDTILRCLPEDDAQVIRQALLEQHAAGRRREKQVGGWWQALALSVGLGVVVVGLGWTAFEGDKQHAVQAVEQKCLEKLGIIEGRVP